MTQAAHFKRTGTSWILWGLRFSPTQGHITESTTLVHIVGAEIVLWLPLLSLWKSQLVSYLVSGCFPEYIFLDSTDFYGPATLDAHLVSCPFPHSNALKF